MENKSMVYNSYSHVRTYFSNSWTLPVVQVLLGSVFLSIMSQFAIPLPFTPVPVSLQTFAVAILAMTLGPKKASLAVASYLFQALIGLPVLAGGIANPFWMVGPRAGYLIGFFASSYLTGHLFARHASTLLKTWLTCLSNEAIIMSLGTAWLALFIGWQEAMLLGMLPFLPGALMKSITATVTFKSLGWIQSKAK